MRNNIKRYLSGLLVGATLLTSMVPAFAATNYTYETQAKALYDLGLFKGVSTGEYNPDLGSSMDRETGVVMMLRLVGAIDAANAMTDSDVSAALAKYTDANKIEDWAKKPVAYAVKNGLVVGTSETTIGPAEQFIGKMFAAIILRNVGYQITNANYEASTSTMVEKGGLTSTEAVKFNDKNLIRDDMVGMSYGSLELQYATTAKTIIETLVAGGKVDKALAVSLGLIKEVAQSATATQTGAKTFTVKFNAPVDPAKVTVAVNKGAVAVNAAKVTPAADNMSVAVEMATNLTSGDYTITVNGVAASALVATVTAAEQKVAKVEFTSDKAVLDRAVNTTVTGSYKVYNQFNEDLTKTVDESTFTFTSGKGSITANDGVLTITGATFAKDDKVAVTAVHAATGTFGSTVLTVVDKAQVADIAITSLYNEENATLDINSDFSKYMLVVDAKDQYGNKIPYDLIGSDVIINVTDENVVKVGSFAKVSINGVDTTVLPLVEPSNGKAGTAKVTIISKTTGDMAAIDVTVKDEVKADVISLQSPDLAVANEEFAVPFTAVDQFGNAITDAAKSKLVNLVPTFSADGFSAEFTQDYVKGTPKLTVKSTGLTDAKNVVMTILTPTGKLAQLTLNVQAPAKPTVVTATNDFSNNVLLGATSDIEIDNVVVRDQYSRVMDDDAAKYNVAVSTSDAAKVSVTSAVYDITAANTTVTFKGEAKGSATITLKAINPADNKVVAGSEYTFTMNVVEKADIASYELGTIGKIYSTAVDANGLNAYGVDVKVYGVLANGTKVLVPYDAANYQIFENVTGLSNVNGKLVADTTFNFDGKTDVEKEAAVIVTVLGANDTTVLSKNVVVTNVAPKTAKIELRTSGVATKEGDGVVSVALANAANYNTIATDALKITDQYGLVITPVTTVIPTNVPTTVVKGSTFNLTVITDNAQVVTFKVIVK